MSTKAIEKALARLEAVAPDGHGDGALVESARREVDAIVRASLDLREVAFDGPSEAKNTPGGESFVEWRNRIEKQTRWLSSVPGMKEKTT